MATRRTPRRQRGAALMIFLILVVLGALTYLVTNLSPEAMRAQQERQTNEALAQAREALVGYALRYREDQIKDGQYDRVYGYLPLPDLGYHPDSALDRNNNVGCTGEGCDAATAKPSGSVALNYTVIGRFPWRLFGTRPLRDGNGECLWYVVSGSHQRQERVTPMNWDSLGHLDVMVANDTTTLASLLATPHDRPVAIVFSPGPPLAGQDRSTSTAADVGQCGGNYEVSNYLDPALSGTLGGITNYLSGANRASGDTYTDPDTGSPPPKGLSAQGAIFRKPDGKYIAQACPPGTDCDLAANDRGLALSGDALFDTLRKSALYRTDINAMLDRMAGCLRDQFAAGAPLPPAVPAEFSSPADKQARRIPDTPTTDPNVTCYDATKDPRGYFDHYKRQVFAASLPDAATLNACKAAPGASTCFSVGVDGAAAQYCPGVVVLGGQRNRATAALQLRDTTARQNTLSNYLEGDNLSSFGGTGLLFSGHGQFARVSPTHLAHQDIVRCIPSTASFVAAPSALPPGAELTVYNPVTRTLTMGRASITTGAGYAAGALFGCAWQPETRATGSGFRGYFKFNIRNSGDGFALAAVDGDRNTTGACGAAQQHLGYSGNNGYTPPIAHPKLGIEFDTRRNYQSNPPFVPDGFNPARETSILPIEYRTLANGRADPGYAGGHIGIVYWGGETKVATGALCASDADCLSPAVCDAALCKLAAEEDDNVHGQLPVTPATRPPPKNEPAPAVPPTNPPYPPYAVDKLDPSLGAVPTNVDIHIRVEVARAFHAGRDDNARLVKVAAAAPLASLSGVPQTIDGVTVNAGDVVLVTAQGDARTNGVYVAAAGAWARAGSANDAADLPPGTSWFVREGANYMGSLWRLANVEAPVVGIGAIAIRRVRDAVKAVATINVTPSGLLTVDSVALAAGDRVLLAGQTDATQNGVYIAGAGAWARAAPENTAAGLAAGSMWNVIGGSQVGTYWRLAGDAIPGTSAMAIAQANTNELYSSILTTQVWKESSNTGQIERMKITTRAMAQLDPVVRHGKCAASAPLCPASNPADQYCGGVEADTFRYCYTGQQPKLYDSKKVFDIRGDACTTGLACPGEQFCGIDPLLGPGGTRCYQPAFRTTRLGFTASQSTSDEVIEISDFFAIWLP